MVDGYEAELVPDFRSFFGISLLRVGEEISYAEALVLCTSLLSDPTSRFHAKKTNSEYPTSWESVILMNLYDVFVSANSDPKKGKPKPYPRPWKDLNTKKLGKASIPLSKARDFFSKLGYRTGNN